MTEKSEDKDTSLYVQIPYSEWVILQDIRTRFQEVLNTNAERLAEAYKDRIEVLELRLKVVCEREREFRELYIDSQTGKP
jgi:hypothetical protein